jgi:glycosyltransferase involved in cell wall biosynthesis
MTLPAEIGNQRIVHVPRRFVSHEWGGTETVILETARQQRLLGLDPVIMTSMALAQNREDEIGGTPVRRYKHRYPFFGLTASERAAMDKKGGNLWSGSLFKALLKEPGVKLYHAHALKRLGGMVRTAARLRGKPYVVSLHGGVFDVPEAELAELTEPIRGKFEWGRVLGACLGSRNVLRDADHVICVGQGEADEARRNLNHDRISYLPNGVDYARYSQGDGARFRRDQGIQSDAFVVLCISRIDAQKNQLALVEAFARFQRKTPATQLVLIGPETQPDYAAKIRSAIDEHGLGEAVRMLPGLSNESNDLVNAYHAADVFVLPSRHEPFGIVVLEAWCAGKAVIASRVGGLRTLVKDGESGLFVDPDAEDPVGVLARQLETLHADPGLRQSLGEAGRREAESRYDWKCITGELEALYEQAVEHAARRKGGGA